MQNSCEQRNLFAGAGVRCEVVNLSEPQFWFYTEPTVASEVALGEMTLTVIYYTSFANKVLGGSHHYRGESFNHFNKFQFNGKIF